MGGIQGGEGDERRRGGEEMIPCEYENKGDMFSESILQY